MLGLGKQAGPAEQCPYKFAKQTRTYSTDNTVPFMVLLWNVELIQKQGDKSRIKITLD